MLNHRLRRHACNILIRLTLAIVGFGAFHSPALAQAYLYNRADFATGNGPTAAVTADFNGDGKLDLAVANRDDNTVSILLGKPDATFATKVDYPTGSSPKAIVAVDLNGDGKLDLALVNQGANTVSVLIGNGDGSFQARVDYPTGNNPVGIVASDFNGDKKLDLAVVNENDNTVSILLGRGDGTFKAQTAISVDTNPVALASGDFNGDGKLDLITSNNNQNPIFNNNGSVSVLLGGGDGTFKRVDSDAGYAPGALALGDFNRDGILDVVVVDLVTSMSVLLGKGDGTFHPAPASPLSSFVAPSILAVDVNHDGKLDLVAGGNGPATTLFGNGDGTFQPPRVFAYLFGNLLLVAEFNGDSLPDFLFVGSSSSVSVLLGNGNGTFGASANYNLLPVSPSAIMNPAFLTVADFNTDGKADVAVIEPSDPTGLIAVVLGKGDGSFGLPLSSSIKSVSAGPMVSGDFNNDGKADIVAFTGGGSGPRLLSVFLGNGDGTFQASMDIQAPFNAGTETLADGDFNGDGKLDLVITTSDVNGNESVQILIGKGDGTFQTGAGYALPNFFVFTPIVVGDLNHDGKLDLAAGNGEFVDVLLGNGDGTFQSPVSYDCAHLYITDLKEGDFNGDGKLDLIVTTYDGVSVLLGNGDGTLQPHIDSSFAGLGSVVVGDFNGDGKLDIANPGSVAIGNGDGTFQIPRYLFLTPSAAAAGDFNSDGITDLVLVTQDFSMTPAASILLSAPFAAFFPSPLNFEAQPVQTTSAAQEVTMTNIGNASLSLTSVTANGDFAETNTCGGTVAIGRNCNVAVMFTPTTAGTRTGMLIFTDNVLTSPQIVDLTGTGQTVQPTVNLSASSLTLGSQLVKSTSAAQAVTLTNSGNAALMISSVAVNGVFAETNTCGSSLAASSNCVIKVTFTPKAAGSRTGTLTITDNAPGSPQTVALAGTGQDFSIGAASPSSTSATVTAGGSASYQLSITPSGGLSGMVSLACSGAPSEATCTVNPTSATLSGSSDVTASVTVSTTAPTMVSPRNLPPAGWTSPLPNLGGHISLSLGMWLLALLVLLVEAKRQAASTMVPRLCGGDRGSRCSCRPLPTFVLVTLLLLSLGWTACGGGGSTESHNPGTPTGTYSLTVSAMYTSGSTTLKHDVTLKLTVN
jgi:VCBS repeat protein/HYDIN/CFA65/VesB family protein/centrosomal CEP192-like protein